MAKTPKKINLDAILEHQFINKNELARTIWPDVSPRSATTKFYMKKNGTNGNRFTEDDLSKIDTCIQDFIKKIYQ